MLVRNHEKTTKTSEKTQENLKTKGKSRENAKSRKSRNTLAKPMNMWKNDGEKTEENEKTKEKPRGNNANAKKTRKHHCKTDENVEKRSRASPDKQKKCKKKKSPNQFRALIFLNSIDHIWLKYPKRD